MQPAQPSNVLNKPEKGAGTEHTETRSNQVCGMVVGTLTPHLDNIYYVEESVFGRFRGMSDISCLNLAAGVYARG